MFNIKKGFKKITRQRITYISIPGYCLRTFMLRITEQIPKTKMEECRISYILQQKNP